MRSKEETPKQRRAISQVIYPGDGPRREDIATPGVLLTRDQIQAYVAAGDIIIDPYEEKNVGGASVDVRLGQWFYRENSFNSGGPLGGYVNIRAETAAQQLWIGPFKAKTFGEFLESIKVAPTAEVEEKNGISLTDRVIVLAPGENILGHTEEFVGGNKTISTAMHARSSLGRSHLTVCRCAGWGDPGYFNRWTMEFTNNSRKNPLILSVGMRVAQIVFWKVQPVETGYAGKYQPVGNLEEVKRRWFPENMLPKLYLDWDIQRAYERVVNHVAQRTPRLPEPGTEYAMPRFIEYELLSGALGPHWNEEPPFKAILAGRRFRLFGLFPDNADSITKDISQAERLSPLVFRPGLVV